jgi:hypothetical protein
MEVFRSRGRTITQSFTRPADTTAYAAGDVVNNSTSAPVVITIPMVALSNAQLATIMQATLIVEANQATKPDLQLWLFDTAPTPPNDNAAFAPTNTELEALVAIIAFPVGSFVVANSAAGASGNVACDAQALFIQANTAATSDKLFGILVVRNAYTPTSGEKYVLRLKVVD